MKSDVVSYAPVTAVRAVRDGPPWLDGVLLQDGDSAAWLPVACLARLWGDPSLDGATTHIVVTGNVALAVGGYTRTRDALPITMLRPVPANPALRWAAVVDGRALPVLDTARIVDGR